MDMNAQPRPTNLKLQLCSICHMLVPFPCQVLRPDTDQSKRPELVPIPCVEGVVQPLAIRPSCDNCIWFGHATYSCLRIPGNYPHKKPTDCCPQYDADPTRT